MERGDLSGKRPLAAAWRTAQDVVEAYGKWQEDDGSHLAASVSYYMAVSFFPLSMLLLSATGLVLQFTGWGQNARHRLLALIADQTAPALAQQVEVVLANVQQGAAITGPLGLLTLLLTAILVFVHLDDAMDKIWNVPRHRKRGVLASLRGVLVDRLRAFAMLWGVGLFVIAGFVASMGLSAVTRYAADWIPLPPFAWELTTLVSAVTLNWLLFAVIYRTLPKAPVRWSEAARGALLASVLWEAGRRMLAAFVITSNASVYGVVGAFVAIMLWIFYGATILFLGAEYIQVFCARCELPAETTGKRRRDQPSSP